MNDRKNRLWVALGSVAAVAMLLGAFVVVWLIPRGPESSSAQVSTSTIAPASQGNSKDLAPFSGVNYAQSGAPSMAAISDQPHIVVQGTGSISAKPDMADLQIGVIRTPS